MPVINTHTDTEALSLTVIAEFDASIQRVWRIWADPRQLERWWGPPSYPATFEIHEFTPTGRASYFMTGPDGDKASGWWRFTAIEEPNRLEFDMGFANESGEPVTELGSAHAAVTLEEVEGRTRMTIVSTFESAEQQEQMLAMGMEEGMAEAVGQIDALLAESPAV
ncbi:SRPBCC domain-containing protein [Arthrobacter ginkgonis]|uniref:SRPBCC domain-containing protein n=1 Tax=Arthrobacter ginkgonis TaxID=1630594 RepID=A0ABP7CGW0_9MICC